MKLGGFELHIISDGNIWLDGGAMFGVVPKPLWSRKTVPDDRNRIRLGLNCLLIRTGKVNILVDTGCGFKYSQRERDIYLIDHQTDVQRELNRLGLKPEDIDIVINTHLHFDHCGGNTRLQGETAVPSFPAARYLVRRQEYEDAMHTNERTRATYFAHNWNCLQENGQLELVEGDQAVVPGIELVHTPGHTPGHQSIKLQSGGKTLFYIADLCPTTAHVPLPWIMGYDLFPLTTLETRKKIYRQAVDEEWLVFFEHDPDHPCAYLLEREGRIECEPVPWQA